MIILIGYGLSGLPFTSLQANSWLVGRQYENMMAF